MSITLKKQLRAPFRAKDYILHNELVNAVEVAISLGQPLLITGEPGTGKTKLAWKVADELSKDKSAHFSPEPLIFYTKTSSSARDLFYTYDAISHFQAANVKREAGKKAPQTADFIELQALGKAIALTNPARIDASNFATVLPDKAQSSVVLVDEIDKAPRDITNDILNEIENYAFRIKEQNNYQVDYDNQRQIVVIMTSNSEKNLPDAFLRRCVFYHIPFPSGELLFEIVKSQLGAATAFTDKALKDLLLLFDRIRKQAVRKKPATAELIGWLRILELQGYLGLDADQDQDKRGELLRQNLSILVKTKEDLDAVRAFLEEQG